MTTAMDGKQSCPSTDFELPFTGERIVPGAANCEPLFALKMYQEHIARYLFAAQIVRGKRVLDVGCGVGYGAQLLARRGASSVTAFDISEQAIQHARRFYPHPNLEYFVSSAEAFSLTDRFDIITCFELIEHLHDQHGAIELIASLLKPDGVLFISTPRPLGKPRSAFHTRELSFLEFRSLLECHFAHSEWFFENNHFASLVCNGHPIALKALLSLHPQFSIGQADYVIAVASQSSIDRAALEPQLVLNDDAYVLNLEKDVQILHSVEAEQKKQIEMQASQLNSLAGKEEEIASARDELARLRTELQSKRDEVASAEANAEALRGDLEASAARGNELALTVERLQNEAAGAKARLAAAPAPYEMTALVGDCTEAHAIIRQVKAERDRLAGQVSELQCRLAENELQRRAIIQSRSWRITEPLRQLAWRLRGQRQDPLGVYATQSAALPDSSPNGDGTTIAAADFAMPHRPHFDLLFIIGCHDGESKRYRVANLLEGLIHVGFVASSCPQDQIQRLLLDRFSANAVVLFRTAYDANIAALLAYCRKRQIVSIFDIDDLVFEPENIDYVRVVRDRFAPEERAQYRRGVELYQRALLACDRATCTTEFLAERIRFLGKPAGVIPNGLNDHQLQIANQYYTSAYKRAGDKIRIAYFSGSNTHQVDFQSCEDAILEILGLHPETEVVLVGLLDLGPKWERFRNRVEKHPMLPCDEMLRLKATIDINLAPLEVGNPYCESKSQLKIFEAAIVGKPTVASAISSYTEAISDGVDGFLARTMSDWINALEALVSSAELRKNMGQLARARALKQFSPNAIVEKAVQVYGLDKQEATHFDRERKLRIAWIIPGLMIGGGHRNILRAAYFLEQFGHQLDLYFTNLDWTPEKLREEVNTHFYPLQCPMHPYRGEIRETDVLLATHWTTVEVVMRERPRAREIIYFVQDFEPAFAPMGTEYILAENTYRLGLYAITSGPWCEKRLRELGCEADHFVFPVDRSVYHPRVRRHERSNSRILFFAKPEMPRRCYDLGIRCLAELSRVHEGTEIILFGSSHVDPSTLSFKATVRALVPTITDLAEMYCDADLGIVFSTTNPSLVPYEMMASGLPVVDVKRPGNEINYDGRDDIAFLADPDPLVMARQIARLLEDPNELEARSRKGLEFVQNFPSEYEMARRVEDLILRRMAKVEAVGVVDA